MLKAVAGPRQCYIQGQYCAIVPLEGTLRCLKQVIRSLTLQVDSEVMEVRKETCGPNRSRVIIVLETPDEN